MERVNQELSRKASGILSLIGEQELVWLLDQVYELFAMYDKAEEVDEALQHSGESTDMVEEANTLRLIQTARALSRIAEAFERPFRKINKKFGGFDQRCEHIIEMDGSR